METAESDSERGVSRSDSEAEAGDGDDKQKKGNKPTPFWKSLRLTNVINNFNLRAHKFSFQWDLVLYLSICMVSLVPFVFTGNRLYAIIPISIWVLYNVMFFVGARTADSLIPGFGRFKHTVTAAVDEFFSTKLLPIMSISFIVVVLSLMLTGRKLGGPPLCFAGCRTCLARWSESIVLPEDFIPPVLQHPYEIDVSGCGHLNGRELLGYYTMAQTSFTLFVTVLLAMAICMAWQVAEDELDDRADAEKWLKKESPLAFELREEVMQKVGRPASSVRPEGNVTWVMFGIIAALTFTLLGWHSWSMIPPSRTSTLLIILNFLSLLTSTLMLHLGFFGRVLTLYKRNLMRVAYLSELLKTLNEDSMDAWWNCRNFVLNDDLALDYDLGGLAVSLTFVINVCSVTVVIIQTFRDGFQAMLEPPGSYCAYGSLYITMCLLKIFNFAMETFDEQMRHMNILQRKSIQQMNRSTSFTNLQRDHIQAMELKEIGSNPVHSNPWGNTNDTSSFLGMGVGLDLDDHSSVHSNDMALDLGLDSDSKSGSLDQSSSGVATKNFIGAAQGALSSLMTNFGMSSDKLRDSSGSNVDGSGNPSPLPRGLERNASVEEKIAGVPVAEFGTRPPSFSRGSSLHGASEIKRQTLMNMISQIRQFDPYPCVLGIPMMPALFSTSKFYLFILFTLIGLQVMVSAFRNM